MKIWSLLQTLGREPLLHFVLIGAAVFLVFPSEAQRPDPAEDSRVIEITEQALSLAEARFVSTWNRAPTAAEAQELVDELVREEVLVREALALGLDSGDGVIRQRLRMKMEFIGEAATTALEPTPAELEAWYADNAVSFAPPASASFAQILLKSPSDAEVVLAALAAGAEPATLGLGTQLPGEVDRSPQPAVDGVFGAGFFEALRALPRGEWAGPVRSGYGSHLVRVLDMTEPEPPPLDDVRAQAVDRWRSDQAAMVREAQYEALRSRYDVRLPQPVAE